MTALGLVLALLMGVTLGVLGGGGSILTVPLLVYVFGLSAKPAIATSLLVVAVTSAASVLAHARHGHVCWRTASIFGPVAMAGAAGGGYVAAWFPGTVLLILFALTMLVTAAAMLRRRTPPTTSPARAGWRRHALLAAEGVVVGAFTGLIGAGGGFLVVPALALLAGLPMPVAVGTSLAIIAMNSSAGLAGYLTHVAIDLELALLVAGVAVAGALAGVRLTGRLAPDTLRRAFAWFVLAMGTGMLLGELAPPALSLGAAVAVAIAGAATLLRRRGTVAAR